VSTRPARLAAFALAIAAVAGAAVTWTAHSPSGTAVAGPTDPRTSAQQVAAAVPLPAGGNVNGIRWEELLRAIGQAEIAFIVRFNAACQWYRAAAEKRQSAQAASVIRAIPTWPGFAGTDAGRMASEVGEAILDGRSTELARAALAECRRSHDREVQYARSRGLVPST
jgi:hypothetical protein